MSKKVVQNLTKLSIFFVFLVIIAGSVVRTTGSGMGCPDWPKCFDQWVPPTEVSQLPSDYQGKFSNLREKKIIKFAKILNGIGFEKEANSILSDKSLLVEEPFNPLRTWTEYANRLVGFIAGNLVLLTFIFSIKFRKIQRKIPLLAFFNLVLISFQAWFGSIVVATNLLPWTITLHMMLALLLVACQIILYRWTQQGESNKLSKRQFYLGFAILVLLLTQIIIGTQVRQAVDNLHHLPRDLWIGQLIENSIFPVHRTFSILVAVISLWLFSIQKKNLSIAYKFFLLAISLEILSGIVLSYFHLPHFAQPIHLTLACFMFSSLILFLLPKNKLVHL